MRIPRHPALVTTALLLLLGVVGCGGAGPSRATTTTSTASGSSTSSVTAGGGPSAAPVPAGLPGLRTYPMRLGRATLRLSGEGENAAASAPPGATNQLSRKIAAAPSGAVIHLASGYYPAIQDMTKRTSPVTISGQGDATKPVIDGARLLGASNVRFVDVAFSKTVLLNHAPVAPYDRPARNIEIVDSTIDCGARATKNRGGAGIVIRGGSRNVSLRGDYVHDCVIGLSSQPQDAVSVGISITHCLFENFYGDAIDLGAMHDVTISDNVIRDIAHTPGFAYHDDGIQFLGNTAGVVIARNVLANSHDQLLFIQDAIKGQFSHTSTNSDIAVVGNLIYGAGAFAVQDQGGVDVAFVGNTIWAAGYGSLLIRKSGYTGIVPNHTLVADNVVQRYGLLDVPGGVVQGYNMFSGHPPPHHHGLHDVYSASTGLTAPRRGRFGISRRSPARGSAAPRAMLLTLARRAGADSAMLRLLRTYQVKDRGAVAYGARQPSYGAPFTLTLHPLR